MKPSKDDYICLADSVFPKLLESPCLYNIATDELYELNEAGFKFSLGCDGTRHLDELEVDEEFLDYCLAENILTWSPHPIPRTFKVNKAAEPSLRYLELQITWRCNLKCQHCYQNNPRSIDLPLSQLRIVLENFNHLQGLRLLVSGGEPMLHPEFWQCQEELPRFALRTILITNGTLITRENASRLRFHEVQVSLDGLETAHDAMRGKGTFARVLASIETLKEIGVEVSVATMVTALNQKDFPELQKLLRQLEVKQWNVDVPVISGRLSRHRKLWLPYREAAAFLSFGWRGGYYASSGDYACGSHLCAVLPNGSVAKCGFYVDTPVGSIEQGLEVCWQRLKPIRLKELACWDCPVVADCRGGCRYRALLYHGGLAPDPVQCFARGFSQRLIPKERRAG